MATSSNVAGVPATVADVLAENQASHDEADDHDWDEADEVAITLDGDTADDHAGRLGQMTAE